jgi:hypothetical protein
MAKPLVEEILTPVGARSEQRRVCAVILLAGGAGTRAFAQHSGRPVFQMPVTSTETVMGIWHSQVRRLIEDAQFAGVSMIIAGGERPQTTAHWDSPRVEHLEDPQELRGTGGVLHDITAGYPDDAHVLVASAATLLMEPLERVVGQLVSCGSDAALCSDEAGTPGSLMLIRTRSLRSISAVGFVDLKEQAMPGIAAGNSVAVLRRRTLATASLRTPGGYLAALRRFHSLRNNSHSPPAAAGTSEFAEHWKPLFSIVEPGADVAPDARIHDSVVLVGAHVGRGATIVRSIVCPGARVGRDAVLVDQVVTGN